jgi:uncharacterized protein YecE (DUF72 family)
VLYPHGTRSDAYLRTYAEEFASVEIDSTFYGTPDIKRLRSWAAKVPERFRFSLKLPREITHERRLCACEKLIDEFYTNVRELGPKLGCVLWQFERSFSRVDEPLVREAIALVPPDIDTAIEFRDPAWYAPDVQAMLEERGIALAVADAPFVPRELMAQSLQRTRTPLVYLRLIGDHNALDRFDRVAIARETEIAWWANELRSARLAKVERAYAYVNNHYQGHSPATVRALKAALGVAHTIPQRAVQPSLFASLPEPEPERKSN